MSPPDRASCPGLVTAEIPGDAAYPGNSQHIPHLEENMAAAEIQLFAGGMEELKPRVKDCGRN